MQSKGGSNHKDKQYDVSVCPYKGMPVIDLHTLHHSGVAIARKKRKN